MAIETDGIDRHRAVAVALGAAVWGLYWIPLRAIERAGISGPMVIVIANVTAAATVVLYLVYRHLCADSGTSLFLRTALRDLRSRHGLVLGGTLGLSSVFYMLALLHTDVVRAVFLFYLLPVWAMLAARLLYREAISRLRLLAIALTLAGVWLLLGGTPEQLLVLPGFGDWLAILAGMTWGLGLALLTDQDALPATSNALAVFTMAAAFALLSVMLASYLPTPAVTASHAGASALATGTTDLGMALLLAAGFGAVLLAPSVLIQVWGAAGLPASVAAILTTTEILVATLTAVLLIGTSVGLSGAVGAGLIAVAIALTVSSAS